MIKLYYYSNIPNFGDAINPILISRFLNRPSRYTNRYSAKLCGIGSLLEKFTKIHLRATLRNLVAPTLNVWSTGFMGMQPDGVAESFGHRKMKFWAIRGKHSLKRVERIRAANLSIPLGDGGLLMSLLLEKEPPKRFRIGWIPHFIDFGNPVFRRLQELYSHSIIINLQQDPLVVLEQIASCEFICSTAMHGLIAADSLGIPNMWIKVSDKVSGDGYKFRDYYSVYGIEDPHPIIVNSERDITVARINEMGASYAISREDVSVIQNRLLRALREIPLSECE